jgi:hypothetical protein
MPEIVRHECQIAQLNIARRPIPFESFLIMEKMAGTWQKEGVLQL